MISKRSSIGYFSRSTRCWLSLIVALLLGDHLLAQINYLNLIQDKLRSGTILSAQFNHEFIDAYTQETSRNEGNIWIGWQQYRIETAGKIIVVNGELSKVLDRGRHRVIISDYDPELDDFAPSKIIGGLGNTYQVVDTKSWRNTQEFNLQSSDPFSTFEQMSIRIDSDFKPIDLSALDMAANRMQTSFSEVKYLPSSSNLFELIIPEGAEIIDIRYE
tara:strand:- start:592 stop:1242 length:651 start_codon:yes stop_codon:yes gene_type:complete